MKVRYIFVLLVVVAIAVLWSIFRLKPFEIPRPESIPVTTTVTIPTFARAENPREWDFPEDFGPHPDYQTEWWYYTGNLEAEDGERFGYQLTFFRRALLPSENRIERKSNWAADQVYMAHFAVSDIDAGEHYGYERFTRGAAGLAGAQSKPFQVWLENWQIKQIADGKFILSAAQEEIGIDLILEDLKGPILHGNQGYSQKGPEAGNASYYYSQTRLLTSGSVQTVRGSFNVNGLSWKDHEFSTSALSPGQVGWDWFSVQLDEGSELMVFQIRRDDGSIDPFSSGTWINPDGETIHLNQEQFEIQEEDIWRSQNSGAEYPNAWRLSIPSISMDIEISPLIEDQELDVSYSYWEGAVDINGTKNGMPISGSGYVEMTGYAASMEGQF